MGEKGEKKEGVSEQEEGVSCVRWFCHDFERKLVEAAWLRVISMSSREKVTISRGNRSVHCAPWGHGSGWNRSRRLGVIGVRNALSITKMEGSRESRGRQGL
jgi:hypothetical protein